MGAKKNQFAIEDLADVHERCAGIDVHKESLSVCVIVPGADGKAQGEVRQWGTTTRQLRKLREWLGEEGVTHVVMESTGVYWKPVWQILDDGQLHLLLANAGSVKNVPGRKTDQADCIWLATLLRKGLVKGSFIPPAEVRALRDLCRGRTTLIQQRSQIVLRIQKLLEEANIKLDSVITDVMGVSGRAILEGLSEAETDPEKLAERAVPQLAGKLPQLIEALEGKVLAHQRFILREWLRNYRCLTEQIEIFEREIEHYAIPFEAQIVLLDEIPGINRIAAVSILAETGVEMNTFPTAPQFCAWAGLCPGNNETGGKRRRSRSRRGNRWLRGMLTQCAWAASRKKTSYFHAQYRKLVPHCGNKRTLIAVAHSILNALWHMLRRNEPFRDLGADYFDRLNAHTNQHKLVRKLERLGFKVILQPAA